MAWCNVHFFGESIQKHSAMNVLLPEGDGPFPVLVLLHGLSDDYSIWHRRTSIEQIVATMPLIVVMPDGHRSFYCNDPNPGGCAYEDHIVNDVVGFVDRTFPTVAEASGRAIGGLSMGGYGAMMLALRHPDVFSAVSAHSSAFHFTHRAIAGRADVSPYAASFPAGKYDCFALAESFAAGDAELAIRFDCGADDGLLEANRDFHAHLDRLGIDHQYAEYPGAHTWEYWGEHIRDTLAFIK